MGSLGHQLIHSRWFEKIFPTESGWKRRSKNHRSTGVSRGNDRDVMSAFVFAPIFTPLIYIHFCVALDAWPIAGGWRKCDTLLIFLSNSFTVVIAAARKENKRPKWKNLPWYASQKTRFLVRVPGREFRFLAPPARQHLFLKLNQLILWRRIRICLLSFRQSCECCQTNGFARPVLRDRVSLATKVTCATAHIKVCSFGPHFRLFCSTIINFSKKFFCSPMIEVRILNRG